MVVVVVVVVVGVVVVLLPLIILIITMITIIMIQQLILLPLNHEYACTHAKMIAFTGLGSGAGCPVPRRGRAQSDGEWNRGEGGEERSLQAVM